MKGNTLIIVIIALTVGLLVGNFFRKPDDIQYFEKPDFKTKVIVKDKFKADTGGTTAKIIPPKIVYEYKAIPYPVIKYVPQVIHDTIRLTDTVTGKTVNLYPCWYNAYLGIPKLVSGRFTKTGISLDLYDTGCKMQTKVYQVDYNNFDYYWNGTDLKIGEAKVGTIPKTESFWQQFSTNSNAYITHDLLSRSYSLSADYTVSYRRIGLYTQANLNYKTEVTPSVNVGLRFKLK